MIWLKEFCPIIHHITQYLHRKRKLEAECGVFLVSDRIKRNLYTSYNGRAECTQQNHFQMKQKYSSTPGCLDFYKNIEYISRVQVEHIIRHLILQVLC